MRDRRVQERLNHQRDEFIDSIPEHRVHDIASSHRDGKHCTAFQKPRHGSYNVCYFVSFEDGVKWVVRVPLAPRLAFGARAKLESEIATMQYASLRFSLVEHANWVPAGWSLRRRPFPSRRSWRTR